MPIVGFFSWLFGKRARAQEIEDAREEQRRINEMEMRIENMGRKVQVIISRDQRYPGKA